PQGVHAIPGVSLLLPGMPMLLLLPVVIPCVFPTPVHCSPPKAVANADIDAGNRTELNSRLRYSCKPGYKRKAGTSSLIQCILWNGSEPRWTNPTLQCIRECSGEVGAGTPRTGDGKEHGVHFPADGVSLLCFPTGDPALSRETPSPASTTQRGEEQDWDRVWSCHSHGKATAPRVWKPQHSCAGIRSTPWGEIPVILWLWMRAQK
uniref:Sushi domain-containing protein n=1 Tax=Serinus canaria TaxID=9135 RepID=A0A8C9UF15_SERCA